MTPNVGTATTAQNLRGGHRNETFVIRRTRLGIQESYPCPPCFPRPTPLSWRVTITGKLSFHDPHILCFSALDYCTRDMYTSVRCGRAWKRSWFAAVPGQPGCCRPRVPLIRFLDGDSPQILRVAFRWVRDEAPRSTKSRSFRFAI